MAATKVIESGVLSQFLGERDQDFYGGSRIREFENRWSEYFKVQYAVSVNSCTSGLMVALGAIGLEPGDEVIVSTWTMCASATSILIWNAIPVFADIEDETFCNEMKVKVEEILIIVNEELMKIRKTVIAGFI